MSGEHISYTDDKCRRCGAPVGTEDGDMTICLICGEAYYPPEQKVVQKQAPVTLGKGRPPADMERENKLREAQKLPKFTKKEWEKEKARRNAEQTPD